MPQAARVSRVTSDSDKRGLCPTNLLSLPAGRSCRRRLCQSRFWENGPPYQGSEHLLSAQLLPPENWITDMLSILHSKMPRTRRSRPEFRPPSTANSMQASSYRTAQGHEHPAKRAVQWAPCYRLPLRPFRLASGHNPCCEGCGVFPRRNTPLTPKSIYFRDHSQLRSLPHIPQWSLSSPPPCPRRPQQL